MDSRIVAALVLLTLGAVASAQSCEPVPTTGLCAGYFASQTNYVTGVTVLSESDLNTTINTLDENGFCTHCKNNLRRFLCGMVYPDCDFSGFLPEVAIPSEGSCTAAFDTCIPPDTPATIRTFMTDAFRAVFQTVDPSVTDCPSLYTYIRNQPVIGPTTFGDIAQYNNIATAYDYIPNCTCVVPQGLTTCGSVVDYPVWSLVAALQSTFDSVAASAISSITSGLGAAGASCSDCETQARSSLCTSFFYRCSADRSRLFIPPCTKVCDDLLRSCRIDQLNTPGVLAMVRNISNPATAQLLTEAVSNCTKEPFLPIVESQTSIETSTSSAEFNIRRFTSNSSIACQEGTYTPSPRCPCVSPNVASTACATHVDYQVWAPIRDNVRPLLDGLLSPLSQLSQLCPSCATAAQRAVCQQLLPKCDDTTVLRPACEGDCELQMSTCNATAIAAQCSTIKNNLPFKSSDFGSSCFTGGSPVTPQCQICIPLTNSATCQPHVSWPIFAAVSSQTSQIETLMSIVASTQLNYASCPGCNSNMRKLYCSALFVPCSDSVITRMINRVLAGASLSFTDLSSLLPLVDQPCFDECSATTTSCLTTLASTPASILNCNSSSVSLFGQNVNFGGPIFSQSPTCYRHNIGQMPPSTCTVLRPPPALPPVLPPVAPVPPTTPSSGSGVPTDGSNNQSGGGVPAAAIAVPIVLILIIGVGVFFGVMYLKKMWIFKVHKPDPRMFEG